MYKIKSFNSTSAMTIILAVGIMTTAKAQDILHRRDNTQIKVTVSKVAENTVVYKKFEKLVGPDYEVSQDELIKITYSDGSEDLFVTKQEKNRLKFKQARTAFSKKRYTVIVGNAAFPTYSRKYGNSGNTFFEAYHDFMPNKIMLAVAGQFALTTNNATSFLGIRMGHNNIYIKADIGSNYRSPEEFNLFWVGFGGFIPLGNHRKGHGIAISHQYSFVINSRSQNLTYTSIGYGYRF